jgi:hypothetical protein
MRRHPPGSRPPHHQGRSLPHLRLETALHELGVDTDELLGRLDASRERRNEASYGGSFIAQASVRDAEEATTELLDLARAFIGASDAAAGCTLPTELLPAAPYRRGSPLWRDKQSRVDGP